MPKFISSFSRFEVKVHVLHSILSHAWQTNMLKDMTTEMSAEAISLPATDLAKDKLVMVTEKSQWAMRPQLWRSNNNLFVQGASNLATHWICYLLGCLLSIQRCELA